MNPIPFSRGFPAFFKKNPRFFAACFFSIPVFSPLMAFYYVHSDGRIAFFAFSLLFPGSFFRFSVSLILLSFIFNA